MSRGDEGPSLGRVYLIVAALVLLAYVVANMFF